MPAKNNRSLNISPSEIEKYKRNFKEINSKVSQKELVNCIINQDVFTVLEFFPEKFIDLIFIDPPYNMSKSFNGNKFRKKSVDEYTIWFDNLISKLIPLLKETASVYVCSDWLSSTSIHLVLNKYLYVRNRITWEREKGRGAKHNWKNSSEDIWFATVSDEYYFNVESVKLKKRVIAPYRENGTPKGWKEINEGKFRLTHPSNIWTDITVPFWSMPENTEHPTQKPEKLLAKIILSGSKEGELVFDPFLGSGTSAVVAKKLSRNFLGIELDTKYAAIAEKRLDNIMDDMTIQGYDKGVFWERNSINLR
ncbi:MAG: site-specific DNA-methyltransferase [Melioribacteraceae bacterium]|nr:site-specific DNA-methyltransferase [Melioribacteraceae bacterium]